jgi:hypothetical protein
MKNVTVKVHTKEIQNSSIKLGSGAQDLERMAPRGLGEYSVDEYEAQHSLHKLCPAEENHQRIGDGISVIILGVLGVQVCIEVAVPGFLNGNLLQQLLSEGDLGDILSGHFVIVKAIGTLQEDVNNSGEEEPED